MCVCAYVRMHLNTMATNKDADAIAEYKQLHIRFKNTNTKEDEMIAVSPETALRFHETLRLTRCTATHP